MKVNGSYPLGDKPTREGCDRIDGVAARYSGAIYIALNKPRGYLSDIDDTHPKPTVNDLIGISDPLFAVGRLDLDSEGLILMTNDGELANRLTHPRYHHEKEYEVFVIKTPDQEQLEIWRRGVVSRRHAHTAGAGGNNGSTATAPGCGSSCTKARSARSAGGARIGPPVRRSSACASVIYAWASQIGNGGTSARAKSPNCGNMPV